jgi:hypothetical protein
MVGIIHLKKEISKYVNDVTYYKSSVTVAQL